MEVIYVKVALRVIAEITVPLGNFVLSCDNA